MAAIVSTNTAEETRGVKRGLSQAWQDLRLMDNRLTLVKNPLYAVESSKLCTGNAYYETKFKNENASTAQKFDKKILCQQTNPTGRHLLK